MQTQAGRSAKRQYRHAVRTSKTSGWFPLAIFMATGAGIAAAGKKSLSVMAVGTAVLGPALLTGLRRTRSIAGRMRAGAQGEQTTAEWLKPYCRRGWVVLHDLAVPGAASRANVDHLLIGPGGLVLIDSKRRREAFQGDDWHGWSDEGRPLAKEVATTLWELQRVTDALSDVLAETRCPARAVWVVHGPVPRCELAVDGVAIIGHEDLDALLGGPQVLSAAQVEYIAGAVRRRLRPA